MNGQISTSFLTLSHYSYISIIELFSFFIVLVLKLFDKFYIFASVTIDLCDSNLRENSFFFKFQRTLGSLVCVVILNTRQSVELSEILTCHQLFFTLAICYCSASIFTAERTTTFTYKICEDWVCVYVCVYVCVCGGGILPCSPAKLWRL